MPQRRPAAFLDCPAGFDLEPQREHIQIRVSEKQKQAMVEAAAATGQDLSNWLRGLALKEVRRLGVK